MTRRRHLLRAGLVSVLAALASSSVAPARAADSGDDLAQARKQREDARSEQARAAAQIDLLHAADADVANALATIERSVAFQQGQVDAARARLADAEADAATQQTRVAAADQALTGARAAVATLAAEQYIDRTTRADAQLVGGSLGATMRRDALHDFATGRQGDAVEQLRAAEADERDALDAARRAVEDSTHAREALTAELDVLQQRLGDQQRVRGELQRRIDEWERREDELAAAEKKLAAVIAKEQAKLLSSQTKVSPASLQGFQWPARGPVGSGFGLRMHPIFKVVRPHNGLDVDAAMGAPVQAAKAGRVIFAGVMEGFGNVVMLQHDGPVSTTYAHLSKILVSVGNKVDRGDVIGLVGATGWATGPHLHFEVRVNGQPRDPMLFLP